MDPVTIAALIQAAASAVGAMKGGEGPEGAGLPAAGGDMSGFGASGDVLKEMMANSGEPSGVSQFNPGPSMAPAPMPTLPGLANFAPPQEPITQARTYSEGVDAPNVAPPVGGSTGGEISVAQTGPMGLSNAPPEWQGPIQAPEWQGPIQGGPAAGDPRLQDYMGMLGPMAGMAGAAMGGGADRAPGSGGFPARPFNMPLSLNSLPPRRRY